MNTDYFISNYDSSLINNSFNESQSPRIVSTQFTSSITTTQIDGYRQGIELTSYRYFDKGTFKIHAGERGHILKHEYLNDDLIFRYDQNFYSELDTFDPVAYINTQDNLDQFSIFTTHKTWPIVTKDANLTTVYNLNGVIEPFCIRDVILLKEPISSIHGDICSEGYERIHDKSIEIKSCDYFKQSIVNVPFIDSYEKVDILSDDYFVNFDEKTIEPFDDRKLPKDIPFSTYNENDLSAALCELLNTGSLYQTQDMYVRYNQISMSTGFTYDSVQGIGVDSIAFAGQVY